MLVLDALFDHFQQISSNVEITGSLVQCSPISAVDVRVGSRAAETIGLRRLLGSFAERIIGPPRTSGIQSGFVGGPGHAGFAPVVADQPCHVSLFNSSQFGTIIVVSAGKVRRSDCMTSMSRHCAAVEP